MKLIFTIAFLLTFSFSFGQKTTTKLENKTINKNKKSSPQEVEIKFTSNQIITDKNYNLSNITVKKEVIITQKNSNADLLLKTESTLNNINQNSNKDNLIQNIEKVSISKEKQNKKQNKKQKSETKIIKN